ncbi:hypothetical protein N431DRAFT_511667 [Stipitochalara longipes BDJ]|nr:hypothetical protein N431DRAFT_511667 [Stipitochalara longipes BDJ]
MPPQRFMDLGFSVDLLHLQENEGTSVMNVSNILGRSPGILNFRLSARPKGFGTTVFAETSDTMASDEENHGEQLHLSQDQVNRKRVLDTILGHFSVLHDLMEEARGYCNCRSCRTYPDYPTVSFIRGSGCVRTMAFEETLVLIAHAIADGFCVDDVSAAIDATPITEAMICLFQELCEDSRIVWDTWFAVAASVFLGCPFQRHVLDAKDGGTTFAVIQYGNLAVIAPWVDLSQQLVVEGAFASGPRKGVLVSPLMIAKTESNSGLLKTRTEIVLDDDSSEAAVDFILVPVGESVYRLLMRVQSQNYSRIVDPSDALRRVTRTLPPHPRCKHMKTSILPKLPLPASIYSFDDVLGRWNEESFLEASGDRDGEEKPAIFHITERLTNRLLENIAVALSVGTIAATDDGMCFGCMLKAVERVGNPPDRGDHLFDRFFIMTGSEKSLAIRGRA